MEVFVETYHPTDDPDLIKLLKARRPSSVDVITPDPQECSRIHNDKRRSQTPL